MKKRYSVGAVGLLAVLLITFFPLAWVAKAALPDTVPQTLKYSGSVWNGTVSGLSQVGPVHLKTSPVGLVTGQRAVSFKSEAPYLDFSGQVGLNGEGSLNAKGNIRGMGSVDPRLTGLNGDYDLQIPEINFQEGCISATGTLTSNVLQQNHKLLAWSGPELSGPVRCENGDLVFTLSGKDNMQDINAILRLNIQGGFQIEVDIYTLDSRADTVLPVFGFQKAGSNYRMREAGRWY